MCVSAEKLSFGRKNSRSQKRVATFDKTRQICYNTNQGVLHKTVGGSNLPPEMEVSLVDILSVVIQLLHLILDAVKVTFDLSNKKR